MALNTEAIATGVNHLFHEGGVLKALEEYISVPNQSPTYDPAWATNGLQEKAMKILVDWVDKQAVPGLTREIVALPGRTPLLFVEVAATKGADTVLMYGHMDKQPPLTADWEPGLHPHIPVYRDGKLYGRGGADDGYAIFAAVGSIIAIKAQGIQHPRIVIMIEGCEESGSPDLPHYVAHLKPRIGTPSLIVCLDSGCGNYEQLWLTTSLRGLAVGTLRVEILKEGVHSGNASGVVPSSFRIIRQLLSRVEDEKTGKVLPEFFYKDIPEFHQDKATKAAGVLKETIHAEFPFVQGSRPFDGSPAELLLNKTWKPALSYIGIAGFPTLESAGNVLRPWTTLKLSMRLPPNVSGQEASAKFKALLEENPPYGAKVTYTPEKASSGWECPPMADWLVKAASEGSMRYFNKDVQFMGEGGSIPFMGMLSNQFPKAQFFITGLLGPKSNAHGPNEFLHIDMCKKVVCCVAYLLASHASLH